MSRETTMVFGTGTNAGLATEVAANMGASLGRGSVNRFDDGAVRAHLNMEDVEACGFAVVVGPTGPQSDRATELRQVVNAIRENGNNPRILAVPTYFGDQREDRLHPDGPAVSEAAKLMARSIIDAGADAIITFDIHNRKTLGSVDLPFHSLTIAPLLVPRVAKIVPGPIAVVAPDASAAKIARKRLATPLKAPLVTIHKERDTITGEIRVTGIDGEEHIRGHHLVGWDDIWGTGATAVQAIELMKSLGAIDTTFAAAHPVLCRGKDNVRAVARIRRTESLRRLVVANTLPLSREARRCKTIQRVSIAPLVAAVAMSCELGLSFDEESIYASLAQA